MSPGLRLQATDPEDPAAERALTAYAAELAATFGVRLHPLADAADLRAPRGALLLARRGDDVVGCGGIRLLDEQTAEVKRMWLDPAARGLGLGAALLAGLEERAASLGCSRVVLDTSDRLEAAVATYRRSGYVEVAPYNDNPEARLWFEKVLET